MLDRILASMDPARFVARCYTQVPHSEPGGCEGLVDRATWEVLARILDAGPAEVMVAREGERWAGDGPVDGRRGRALFDDGWTVAVFNAQEHDEGLAELAEGFRRDLGGTANVHVYATPAGRHGFRWHYDAEEVFMLQTVGRKEIGLRKNTVHPWPVEATLPKAMDVREEGSPLQMSVELAAGDWLYVPGGWWHVARAQEDAISIALGLTPPTALDVVDALRRHVQREVAWRQRLPCLGAAGPGPAAQRETLRALFGVLADSLGETLGDEAFLDAFLAAHDPRAPDA